MRVRRRMSAAVVATVLSSALVVIAAQAGSATDAVPEPEPAVVAVAEQTGPTDAAPTGDAATAVVGDAVVAAAMPYCETAANQYNLNFDNGAREYYQFVPGTNTTPHYANCYLQQGATGLGVKALQIALNECYNQGLLTDSIFGAATKAALIRVQKSLGLTADGIYGAQSRAYVKVQAYWSDNNTSRGCQRA